MVLGSGLLSVLKKIKREREKKGERKKKERILPLL